MRAALIDRFDGPVPVTDVVEPACPADGVIVAVHACGVCRSDHHAWKGVDPDVELPHVMGHELAGEIVEVGPRCSGFAVGDRVTAPFILGCGACADCAGGRATACDRQQVIGFTQWGAFAEYVAIAAADFNLVRLPEDLGAVEAAALGCRVTTAWRALADRARLTEGEWLVVHGAGGVGLSAIMLGRALGARTIAVDVLDTALDAATAAGADAVLDASAGDVGAAVRDLTGGGAHVSIDALGRGVTFENSVRSLRKLGRHVQVGMPTGADEVVPLPLLELVYARQLSLHGMRGLDASGFDDLLALVADGRFDPGRLVTARIGLDEVETALRAMDGHQPPGIAVVEMA
ncbi:MAG: alcohol dehydrogenase catalytic domain-containing protein [Actinomycetota bacterium]